MLVANQSASWRYWDNHRGRNGNEGSNSVRQMVSWVLVGLGVIFMCHHEFDGWASKWKELL